MRSGMAVSLAAIGGSLAIVLSGCGSEDAPSAMRRCQFEGAKSVSASSSTPRDKADFAGFVADACMTASGFDRVGESDRPGVSCLTDGPLNYFEMKQACWRRK